MFSFASVWSLKYNTSKIVTSIVGSKPERICEFCSAAKSNSIKPSLSRSQRLISSGWIAIADSKTSKLKIALNSVVSPHAFVNSIFRV